jgi:hypothetical protein
MEVMVCAIFLRGRWTGRRGSTGLRRRGKNFFVGAPLALAVIGLAALDALVAVGAACAVAAMAGGWLLLILSC